MKIRLSSILIKYQAKSKCEVFRTTLLRGVTQKLERREQKGEMKRMELVVSKIHTNFSNIST